jgi:hypothetical protein
MYIWKSLKSLGIKYKLYLYIAAIFAILWLASSTTEYLSRPNQKKMDKVLQQDINRLVKVVDKEVKYYNQKGRNSKKFEVLTNKLMRNMEKYGLNDKSDLKKYIPKKYRNRVFPWERNDRNNQQQNNPQQQQYNQQQNNQYNQNNQQQQPYNQQNQQYTQQFTTSVVNSLGNVA